MTEISFEALPLGEVMSASDAVVVAKRLEPFVQCNTLCVLPKGSQFEGKNAPPYYDPDDCENEEKSLLEKNFPPFISPYYQFEVLELLRVTGDEADFIGEGDTIKVLEAHWHHRFDAHKRYYLEGVRKSPLYAKYATSIEDVERYLSPLILMMRFNAENQCFELTTLRSYESLSCWREVGLSLAEAV